jgi:hypothetical protein
MALRYVSCHRTKSNRPSKLCSACWLLNDQRVNRYLAFFAVFLPAAAFVDFFAVFFAAAIVTTPLWWVPRTVADPLAPRMRGGVQDSLR